MNKTSFPFLIGEASAEWARQCRMHVQYEKQIASTNDWAKELAFSDELQKNPISVFLTDHQTLGRGRAKNSWLQENPGGALLSSWVFQLSRTPRPVTSCRVGLAVHRSLCATWPWLSQSLKAPNDIYFQNQKLGGILIENLQQGSQNCIVVGLGLNIFSAPQLPEATSLIDQLQDPQTLIRNDWHLFLDRLFLELSLAISHSADQLSASECKSLLLALNQNPNLIEKYIQVEPDGGLVTKSKHIHWSEL